jgi:hypothetical protein
MEREADKRNTGQNQISDYVTTQEIAIRFEDLLCHDRINSVWGRLMRRAAAMVLVIVGLCGGVLVAAGERGDGAVIDRFIHGQESGENGTEAKDYRTALNGDLNHDGMADVAVMYTLEGGNGTNNYVRWLAVFVRENGRLVPVAHDVVGGKNYRAIVMRGIKDGVILCETTGYAPKDASCCPTIKGTTRYVLEGEKLRELIGK